MKKIINYQFSLLRSSIKTRGYEGQAMINVRTVYFLVIVFTVIVSAGFANTQKALALATDPTNGSFINPTSTQPPDNSTGNISPTSVDISKSTFKLLICDGPEELRHYNPATNKIEPSFPNEKYVACDFKGLMLQLQHFINIAMVLGVLIAIVGFTWAGALYVSGKPNNITKAHQIFPSIFIGFIIMLSAWFIVYQILAWLTGTSSFGVLLGK